MLRLELASDGCLRPRAPDRRGIAAVHLAPDADPRGTEDTVDATELVVLSFPSMKDGRAFSQARLLRDAGFGRDIRATGAFIQDQIGFAIRCGFTSFDLETSDSIEGVQRSVTRFANGYQGALRGRPAWELRS